MSFVYFLRPVGADGPVKIGCSIAPQARLEAYLPWAPFPLEIAATFKGDAVAERRFHALFRHLHSHHEWFHAAPELTAVIAQIASGAFDAASLPAARQLPRPCTKPKWNERSRQAASWSHRLRHLRKRGVVVPYEVSNAAWRYNCGIYARATPGQPEDLALVEAFLANHPRLADLRRAA